MYRWLICVFLLCGYFAFPVAVDDRDCEYVRLSKQYHWMTPYRYQLIYRASDRSRVLQVHTICAVIHEESGGHFRALSKAGARGWMQVMPIHLPDNPEKLYDPWTNLTYGTDYLVRCFRASGGNRREAFRMYNQGIHGKRFRYRNWEYVDKICRNEDHRLTDNRSIN